MKVNFTLVECKPTRKGESVNINFAEQLGEVIYQLAQTRKDKKLADLVGDSTGEIEVEENDAKAIAEFVKKSQFTYWAKEALLDALGEKEED